MNAIVPMNPGFSFADIERLGANIAKSNLFGIKTPEAAVSLMMLAQAEGLHPATAARDYDIIQGRPAKRAEAMHRQFFEAGGKIKWLALSDTEAKATFSHPIGGEVTLSWDMARAEKAGLKAKENYKKFPRQMLRNRLISEGVRTVWPGATGGLYVPEEVQDFAGTTLDHEPPVETKVEVPPASTAREEINRDVPMKTVKMTWSQLLDSIELALQDEKTAAGIDHILNSAQVKEAQAHAKGATLQRLDRIVYTAEQRRNALDDAAEAAVSETHLDQQADAAWPGAEPAEMENASA